ncbi:MAG TPA: ATP synthase subunit I [Pseudomonadales bacterium]|nr:ATP synthase subunit I [Pseudomonadales bacterium]
MTNAEPALDPMVLAALAGGLLVGCAYFALLLCTVRRALGSPRPGLWFLTSFLGRTAGAVIAVAWIGAGQWQRLVACLVGFMVARLLVQVVVERWPRKPPREASSARDGEDDHAPQPR